jgi:hypothetical protein
VKTVPIIKHISQELTTPEDMEKSSMKMAFFAVLLVFAAGIYIYISLLFSDMSFPHLAPAPHHTYWCIY